MSAKPVLNPADQAFLQAQSVWGDGATAADLLQRLEPTWRDHLQAVSLAVEMPAQPALIIDSLRRDHNAEAQPNPDHVHPTWWVRALRDERHSVQRAVAAHAPGRIGAALRQGLGLRPDDLSTDRSPQPEALRWALALWSNRIVGGPDIQEVDPPIVHALVKLEPSDLYRLAVTTSLAKLAAADRRPLKLKPLDREWFDHFRLTFDRSEPDARVVRLVEADRKDWRLTPSGGPDGQRPRRDLARLGLSSFARLLATVPLQRARWTLQHLPYALSRSIWPRLTLKNPVVAPRVLFEWESQFFRVAVARLVQEGRLRRLTDSGGPS